MNGAFRRTLLRCERADVHPALKKMWKKHYEVNGQVTQHLSPFEQKIVSPMFKDVHYKVFKKLKDAAKEAGPAFLVGIFVYYWAENTKASIAYHHRS